MKRWYFENIEAFKPEVVAKSRFTIENEGRTFTHIPEFKRESGVAGWKYLINVQLKEYLAGKL